jgi:hypothetical protein
MPSGKFVSISVSMGPDGLWFKQDIEYGLNLLGCRVMWTLVALASTAFAAVSL